jgi:hypothetical protein
MAHLDSDDNIRIPTRRQGPQTGNPAASAYGLLQAAPNSHKVTQEAQGIQQI